MKFEKLSDDKFGRFKTNEVLNPILISGGYTDTTGPVGQENDRYTMTGTDPTSIDNLQFTGAASNFTQDGQTTSDETDI
jgi:hypothetical protein